MSCSYFVSYRGIPEDPQRFLEHYRKKHGPIMQAYPGITACRLHIGTPWVDPVAITPANVFLLAELEFPSIEALNTALASEMRQRSRADFVNFPLFDGEITHQAVITETLF